MAQKNKVKELVGRGLHSYHTKALQQMDRIEKKNKEQNHKISILSNELDNDYLTKTEEGSVISLEHSKEGMVYLDELQGNTLVNYCTDGSKEMTLNGDIDVEGVSVTTTEGVDNGKVDVLCEGNTLVNLSPNTFEIGCPNEESTTTFWFSGEYINNSLFKPNTEYSVIFYNKHPEVVRVYFHLGEPRAKDLVNNMAVFTTPSTITTEKSIIHFYTNNNLSKQQIEQSNMKVVILEGDWTNREIPPYFESMKSVGQNDVNGHKIEILSQNKNLFNYEEYYKYFPSTKTSDKTILSHKGDLKGGNHNYSFLSPMKVNFKPNTTYTLCVFNLSDSGQVLQCEGCLSSENAELSLTVPIGEIRYKVFATDSTNYKKGISFKINTSANGENAKYKIMLVEGNIRPNDYIHYNQDKKEILINEPLRGLLDGTRDKFVKINNKLYIEKKCHEYLFNGSENWTIQRNVSGEETIRFQYAGTKYHNTISNYNTLLSDSVLGVKLNSNWAEDTEGIEHGANDFSLRIKRSRLTSETVNGLKSWLATNNIRAIVKRATPIYEPLGIEPTLNTYNDVTHISNNSIIPCNMKIQNSGYNAIIKPSTLYTVALDTNKSGTIGMNLGGAKGTTTNNVLKLTTPATLTDDSLRLFGKGIKGSKVRLLEGDKTNWIPSYFEGMKSSFEDKFDTTDNTYKMEILSNNKNLFNGTWVYDERNNKINSGDLIKVKPNTTYTISDNLNYRYQIYEYADKNKHFNSMYPYAGSYTFTTSKRTHYLRFSTYAPSTDVNVKFLLEEGRSVNSYEPNKSNKIQFSSIEPLRKWDRFVFKDGQLMIERGSKKVDLGVEWSSKQQLNTGIYRYTLNNVEGIYSMAETICNTITTVTLDDISDKVLKYFNNGIWYQTYDDFTLEELKEYFTNSNTSLIFKLKEPTYEEIPHELQKIILEGYENGTLFFDTNIPPTATITYAGETPIVKSVRLNKTEVLNNTEDINDNIIPYLCDMDYRVVLLQLTTGNISNISMARLFGSSYEMLKRDIMSKRYSKEEYLERVQSYYELNKVSEDEKIHLLELIERV